MIFEWFESWVVEIRRMEELGERVDVSYVCASLTFTAQSEGKTSFYVATRATQAQLTPPSMYVSLKS